MVTNAKYNRYFTYIKPLMDNKTVRSVAPYIFSIITIIIMLVFAIRPTVSTIVNLQKNIEENQQVLKELEAKAQNLIEGKKNYENLSPEIKLQISTAIPNKPVVTSVIASLENSSKSIASTSALQIQPLTLINNSLQKEEEKNKLSLGEVNFSYNSSGSFSNLLKVLQNTTSSLRLMQISSVTINKQPENPIVLSITGKAYYLK